jgi:hypothetical protein
MRTLSVSAARHSLHCDALQTPRPVHFWLHILPQTACIPRPGQWDGSAIREILRNDVCRGARVYGRIRKVKTAQGTRSKRSRPEAARTVKEGAHPAIIDPALWAQVKTRREAVAKAYAGYERNFGATKRLQTQFLLTGLLQCAVCGGSFAARLWWMLQAVGHRHAAVLDGGFPACAASCR